MKFLRKSYVSKKRTKFMMAARIRNRVPKLDALFHGKFLFIMACERI